MMKLTQTCHGRLVFSMSPRKKISISHGSPSARAQIVCVGWECMEIGAFIMGSFGPMCRFQLEEARVVVAGSDLPPRGRVLLWVHSLLPCRQQIHNNDIACGAMDTRFKGPEAINYDLHPTS